MARRRTYHLALTLLALFLIGTVVVLSTVSFYLKIDPDVYLTEDELSRTFSRNLSERVPRILHQTWKTEILPEKWDAVSQQCRDMMPD
jgi:inositol phosphorylceramide mannosyltransferase catalytic subunit